MAQGYPQNIQGTIAAETQTGFGRRGREAGQTACKPGSVPSRRKRRSFLWTAHRWTVLATYPGPRSAGDGAVRPKADMRTPIWSCSRRGLPCRPGRPVRGGLLPHPFTLTFLRQRRRKAVCFLWRYPWGRPRRALPAALSPWSPDFPPPHRDARATARPSGPRGRWARRRERSSRT